MSKFRALHGTYYICLDSFLKSRKAVDSPSLNGLIFDMMVRLTGPVKVKTVPKKKEFPYIFLQWSYKRVHLKMVNCISNSLEGRAFVLKRFLKRSFVF